MELGGNDSGFIGSAEPSPASFAPGTDIQMIDGSSGVQQILTIPYGYSTQSNLPIHCIISNNDQFQYASTEQPQPICVVPQSVFQATSTPDHIQIQTGATSNLVTMQSLLSNSMPISSVNTPDSGCIQYPVIKVESSSSEEQCMELQVATRNMKASTMPQLPHGGSTPKQELDLANISSSGEGYFSKENLQANQFTKRLSYNLASNHVRQVQRQLSHKLGIESTPPRQAVLPPREHTPSPPPPMLNLKEELGAEGQSPVSVVVESTQSSTSRALYTSTPPPAIQILTSSNSENIQSSNRAIHHRIVVGQKGHGSYATSVRPNSTPPVSASSSISTASSLMVAPGSTSTSASAHFVKKEFDPGPMDDSLTNIQWLGTMSGQKLVGTKNPQCVGSSPVLMGGSLLHDLSPAATPTTLVKTTAKPVAPKTSQSSSAYIVTNGGQIVSGTGLPLVFDGSVSTLSDHGGVDAYTLTADRDVRLIASEKQIDKISRECGSKKRPPYSYMHLIQMAISSRADKKMTLREIYKWIEDKFPYYKHSVKGGWKNSIRHNLSLYNIFVRQKSSVPGQTGSSYWTLKLDATSKPIKPARVNSPHVTAADERSMNCSTPLLQVVGSGGTSSSPHIVYINNSASTPVQPKPTYLNKPKKGPPLLPKPPPMQAYALIPIQNGLPVMQPQPMLISSMSVSSPATLTTPINTQACPVITQASSLISTVATASQGACTTQLKQNNISSASGSALKRLRLNTETSNGPQKKLPKIFPKASILGRRSSSFNNRVVPSAASSNSLDTSDLQSQMSMMKVEPALMGDVTFSDNSQELPESSLPKPVMYRHKKPRKEKLQCRLDSGEKEKVHTISSKSLSESGFQELAASIEKDLSSPARRLLLTPPSKEQNRSLLTSTPTQCLPSTPGSWISPINGPTPSTGGHTDYLDSGFFTPDSRISFSTPNKVVDSCTKSGSLDVSPKVGSLSALGLPGLTPLKTPKGSSVSPRHSPDGSFNISNQSFTRLLSDFHLDSMMEDGLTTPLDISHLIFGTDEPS